MTRKTSLPLKAAIPEIKQQKKSRILCSRVKTRTHAQKVTFSPSACLLRLFESANDYNDQYH